MNLIEQLGSYDFVKSIRKKKTSNQYLDFDGRQINFSKIDRELLEYRRENNIFEVGDRVVCISDPISPDEFEILTVEQEHIGKWYMRYWKHATPEEIQAGCRL